MDERRAVDRLKDGDIGGLEILVRLHQVRAVRSAYLILRDRSLAEDVVQSAFVKFYEKIKRFDAEKPFAPYFMKIVVNDAVKTAKHRERTVSFPDEGTENWSVEFADPEVGPQELAQAAEDRRRVWAALEKLPPAQRAAIVERYYLGMTEAEMSRSGASPPGTIKWRLHAARKSLAKLLRPQVRAEGPTPALAETPKGGNDHE